MIKVGIYFEIGIIIVNVILLIVIMYITYNVVFGLTKMKNYRIALLFLFMNLSILSSIGYHSFLVYYYQALIEDKLVSYDKVSKDRHLRVIESIFYSLTRVMVCISFLIG